jgi:hypothetical protein
MALLVALTVLEPSRSDARNMSEYLQRKHFKTEKMMQKRKSPVPPVSWLADLVKTSHITSSVGHLLLRFSQKGAHGGDRRERVRGIELHEHGADVDGDKRDIRNETDKKLRLKKKRERVNSKSIRKLQRKYRIPGNAESAPCS